jgi:hypothetical protein
VNNNVAILIGKGDGTFNAAVTYSVGLSPQDISADDFNGDGRLDLAVVNVSDWSLCILPGNGNGTFNAGVYYHVENTPWSIAAGDFNRDGAVDLAVTDLDSSSVSILLNTSPVPTLTGVSPNRGTQGQTLSNVTITGTGLLSASAVSFGSGITVNSFTVNSNTKVTVSITIAADAILGTRNISITTLGGTVSLNNGFTVNQAQISTSHPRGSSMSGAAAAPPQGPVSLPTVSVRSASLSATKVAPGIPITVTANVVNTGTVNGASSIRVYVNGELENSQGITVNSGASMPVTFTVTRNEPGTYSVYVGGANAGSFVVDQFADPNIILYVSGALLVFAFVIGALFIVRKRQVQ